MLTIKVICGVAIFICVFYWWLCVSAVEGYEDERGFHYGKPGDGNGKRLGLAPGISAAAANDEATATPRDAA